MSEEEAPNLELAGIEYHGLSGVTKDCVEAVRRLLAMRTEIRKARILTCRRLDGRVGDHAMVLETVYGNLIAIKSGFASGYGGTGPKGFSRTLGLLIWHGIELEEHNVSRSMLERVNQSALTVADITELESAPALRPSNLEEYIDDVDYPMQDGPNPWKRTEPTLPLAIIDDRLADLAGSFWNDPDTALLRAHRKLEHIVRKRLSDEKSVVDLHGSRLISAAFNGDKAKLTWTGLTDSEIQGRANLFIGTLMAHRNLRAHREISDNLSAMISEFLLINHLFGLEREAVCR